MRVASLLPSATEIVAAVGGELIGISHECDFPADAVRGVASLTSSRDLGRDSKSINDSVVTAMDEALAIYDVDIEALRAANPDVIITQDLCEVCALPASTVERALNDAMTHDVELVRLSPRTLDDVLKDVERIGDVLGQATSAKRVVDQAHEQIASIRAVTAQAQRVPSVLTIEWLEPTMIGGLWTPELVSIAGGEPLAASPGELARTLDPAQLAALNPDVVVIKPCGYNLAASERELQLIDQILPSHWQCRESDTYVVDGNAYFNRSGPRLIDSTQLLAGLLHPELFPDYRKRFAGVSRRLKAGPGLTDV